MQDIADPQLTAVLDVIRRNVLELLPDLDPADVAPQHSLAGLGANSIDRADIVAMSMEDLGISIGVTEFAGVNDIGTLAALLRRHLP